MLPVLIVQSEVLGNRRSRADILLAQGAILEMFQKSSRGFKSSGRVAAPRGEGSIITGTKRRTRRAGAGISLIAAGH